MSFFIDTDSARCRATPREPNPDHRSDAEAETCQEGGELRNQLGLTLKVASERAEIHWRLWPKIEAVQARVTLQMVARLGRVLGVDGGELLSA